MGSSDKLLELKRRLMAGEIDAEEYKRLKQAAYGRPSESGRMPLASGSDSGRIPTSSPGPDPAAAMIARKRQRLESARAKSAASLIEQKRQEMAEAMARRGSDEVEALPAKPPPKRSGKPQLVIVVRPRGLRRAQREALDAARRARQEAAAEAEAEADVQAAETPPVVLRDPAEQVEAASAEPIESSEDEIERRIREARERLRGS